MSPKDAILEVRTGRPSRAALDCLFALIRRLAKVVSWKSGRGDLTDDLVQETWLLIGKIADQYTPDRPLEPFLLEYLRRIGLAQSRRLPLARSEDDDDSTLHELHQYDPSDCMDDEIDRQSAIRAIVSQLAERGINIMGASPVPFIRTDTKAAPKESKPLPALVAPRRKRGEITQVLGKTHQEIRNIRFEMDMTQAEFAAELGLALPTLVSYEHGRTKSVPEKWLERARELRDSNDKLEWRKKFDDVPMIQILEHWAQKLGADPADLPTMAALTGTSISTISRWRNGLVRPPLTELISYDNVVRINVVRLSKSSKAIKKNLVVASD